MLSRCCKYDIHADHEHYTCGACSRPCGIIFVSDNSMDTENGSILPFARSKETDNQA